MNPEIRQTKTFDPTLAAAFPAGFVVSRFDGMNLWAHAPAGASEIRVTLGSGRAIELPVAVCGQIACSLIVPVPETVVRRVDFFGGGSLLEPPPFLRLRSAVATMRIALQPKGRVLEEFFLVGMSGGLPSVWKVRHEHPDRGEAVAAGAAVPAGLVCPDRMPWLCDTEEVSATGLSAPAFDFIEEPPGSVPVEASPVCASASVSGMCMALTNKPRTP